MSWQSGQHIVAEPTGATVSGTSVAAGAQVYLDVSFRLVEWPWGEKGAVSLVPRSIVIRTEVAPPGGPERFENGATP